MLFGTSTSMRSKGAGTRNEAATNGASSQPSKKLVDGTTVNALAREKLIRCSRKRKQKPVSFIAFVDRIVLDSVCILIERDRSRVMHQPGLAMM